jgi:UDPglucose 6-dehydrogenase
MKINNICCIGAGYVGGPTMAVIALHCPEIKITVVDIDSKKIDSWNGPLDKLPVYEPGLSEIIKKVRGKNLFFSDDVDTAIIESEMIFMAVNTPTKTEGEGKGMAADLKYIESSARNIAKVSLTNKIVVEKSTLPVRTAEKIKEILKSENKNVDFEILSNPEFLAEGTAIEDLFKSDRVLIGGDSTKKGQEAVNALVDIYSKWIPRHKILTTNVWSSELSKLASNAMLAQRISSINSLSAICEKTGANTEEISKAIGMDHRIGSYFLKVSPGFGGSCFQKDILNLVYLCKHYGLDEVAEFWHQVIKINNYQRKRLSDKIIEELEVGEKNKVGILGWAFKANTNDSRESSSIYVAKNLIDSGLELHIYDPMVTEERILSDLDNVCDKKFEVKTTTIHSSIKELLNNVDSVVILTDWNEFKHFDWIKYISNQKDTIKIYDGRNILIDKLNSYPRYYNL